jgi:putative tryptophan/tyrosine transport system substrate-binding protein
MISRRQFLASAGSLILARQARAQTSKLWRIGYLTPIAQDDDAPYWHVFREGLRTLGYIDGENIVIERRFSDNLEALPALARELVRFKMDVIVAIATPAALAAKDATASIPIVFIAPSDPVGSGLVRSLSRPGGNVTGLTDMGIDLAAKRLELLQQVVPRLKRVAALGTIADPVWKPAWVEAQNAARRLQLEIVPLIVSVPDELESAFNNLDRRIQALYVAPQAVFYVYRQKIIELATRARLPAIFELREFASSGGLMTYGTDLRALYRNAARFIDKILKGTKPADIPVEQPTEYELVVNLKTAKALGITIPQSILLRANGVIR